jgi:Formylglycine-generating sulfatase enzyme.
MPKNSDYQLHAVCSIEVSENIPCDMAGNVMEWVNDWLVYFRDTSVTNYVGSPMVMP